MTNEFEHIKQLTRRFMDGQTTIEEEERLASYYRTHDVPREWRVYKEMFAYFDAGMPLGQDKVAACPSRRARRVWLAVAAAAAVAVLMVMVLPRGEAPEAPVRQPVAMSTDVAPPDSTASAEADTLNMTPARPVRKPVRRRVDRYRYKPALPKVYLAENALPENPVPADSIAAAEKILAEKLRDIEAVSEALLRNIETFNEVKALEMAEVNYDDGADGSDEASDNDVMY